MVDLCQLFCMKHNFCEEGRTGRASGFQPRSIDCIFTSSSDSRTGTSFCGTFRSLTRYSPPYSLDFFFCTEWHLGLYIYCGEVQNLMATFLPQCRRRKIQQHKGHILMLEITRTLLPREVAASGLRRHHICPLIAEKSMLQKVLS